MIPRSRSAILTAKMWKMYADYLNSKHERFLVWNLIEPYVRPKSFTPIVTVYVAAFYTGVIGAAISEQLYKEKYWEEHPGQVVPLKKPTYYHGPWKVAIGEVPAHLRRTE